VVSGLVLLSGAGQKMKPEELVEKHLASIGSPEARAAVRNRVVSGTATVAFNPGLRNTSPGDGVIVSEGKSVRLGLVFPVLDYRGEEVVFDGSKVATGYIRPGVRSQFSEFVKLNEVLLKEGLFGGVLSTAWPMLDVAGRQPRLEYNGLKKRAGKEYHELRYLARKGGGDVRVLLYFDPQTFQHLQSEYRVSLMDQEERRYTVTEEFGNFGVADGLTLPRSYKLSFGVEGTGSSLMIDWNVTFEQLRHNQQLDPKTFTLQ
jgi:hypothetical protein